MRPHVGWASSEAGYRGLVAECRMALLRLPPAAQAEMVRAVLSTTFVAPWGTWFYATFCTTDPALSAGVTPWAFEWLVGPSRVLPPAATEPVTTPYEAVSATVPEPTSEARSLAPSVATATAPAGTVVRIDRCRLLAEGGCKGMCVNLCQQPTQQWFAALGMPVTLTPEWQSGACEMAWGVTPPPAATDVVVGEACYKGCGVAAQCGRARGGGAEEGCVLDGV